MWRIKAVHNISLTINNHRKDNSDLKTSSHDCKVTENKSIMQCAHFSDCYSNWQSGTYTAAKVYLIK